MLLTGAFVHSLRETLGVSTDSSNKAFRSRDVDAFLARAPKNVHGMPGSVYYTKQVKWVTVAVDPSGGGGSAFAIASYYYTPSNEHALLNVEALQSGIVSEHHDLLVRVCNGLRRIPGLESCGLAFAFECNLGFESQHLIRAVQMAGIQGWCCMSEGPKNAAGWMTTNATKEKSCLTFRSSLESGKMWMAKDFFSITLGPEPAKRRIRDELTRFSVLTNPPKTPFGESKRTYSGKIGGMQDDVAVVMQIALEATVVFYSSPKYREYTMAR